MRVVEGLGMGVQVWEKCWHEPYVCAATAMILMRHDPDQFWRVVRSESLAQREPTFLLPYSPVTPAPCSAGVTCDPLPPQWQPCTEEV